MGVPSYQVEEVRGKEHEQVFVVNCEIDALSIQHKEKGKSRKEAEQRAAEYVLMKILQVS